LPIPPPHNQFARQSHLQLILGQLYREERVISPTAMI